MGPRGRPMAPGSATTSVVAPSDGTFNDGTFHTVLYRMQADGSNPQLLGDPDAFDVEPRISSDGTKVLFERLSFANGGQQNVLWVRDLASGEEHALTAAGSEVEHANWSPDGESIIYNVASW